VENTTKSLTFAFELYGLALRKVRKAGWAVVEYPSSINKMEASASILFISLL
jgi:hypothetical protein